MHYNRIVRREQGQSLVEYALVLVMVALVLIVVVTLFGTTLSNTYCRVMSQMFPDADLGSGQCATPQASARLLGSGPGYINLEAVVTDPDGDSGNPYGAITKVEFYIDSTAGSPVQTEYSFHYCLGSGDSPSCNNFSINGLSAGSHTVIILVYDSDGNVGRTTYGFTR